MKFNHALLSLGLIIGGAATMPQVVARKGSEPSYEEHPPKGKNWEQWHMSHEHQMDTYDPETFFDLHDNGKKGYFDDLDILSMYGLNRDEVVGKGDGMGMHDNTEEVDKDLAKKIVNFVMRLLDVNDDTKITKQEYLDFAKNGAALPDLGVGVGHHSDFESEYELHHWNKYHKDNDREVKNVHKEDVEHDLLHHEHSIEHEHVLQHGSAAGTALTDDDLESRINHANIPNKYYSGHRNV